MDTRQIEYNTNIIGIIRLNGSDYDGDHVPKEFAEMSKNDKISSLENDLKELEKSILKSFNGTE